MLSLLSEANAAVWERSRLRLLHRDASLMTDEHNISDAVERDRSAASQVIPSHRADFFWCARRNLFAKCISYSHESKTTEVRDLAFQSLISHAMLKNVHYNGVRGSEDRCEMCSSPKRSAWANTLLWKETITITHPAGDKGMNTFLQILPGN